MSSPRPPSSLVSLVVVALLAGAGCDSDAGQQKDTAQPTDTVEETSADTATAPEVDDDAALEAEVGPPKPGLGIDYGATPAGALPRWEPAADDWMAIGWPSDRWRTSAGGVTLSNMPRGVAPLIDTYIDFGEDVLDGFGLNTSVYFTFDRVLDVSGWPAPDDTTQAESWVQLVDVTPGSVHRGARIPLRYSFHGTEADPIYPPLTLAIRAVNGFPLVEGNTYCAIVTRALRDADGNHLQQPAALAEALASDDPALAPLRAWLPESPLAERDIAVATCFTTQHATRELAWVADWVAAMDSPEVDMVFEPDAWGEFHGTYTAPNFQAGEKPYGSEGGDIRFDDDGAPIVQAQEELRFLLLTPHAHTMPEDGWPVVIYSHGTGGDYESCRGDTRELIEDGIAVLCSDQPLHGPRGPAGAAGPALTDAEVVLFSFNFVNPYAGRSAFRQAAIDTLIQSKMIVDGRFDLPASMTKSGRALVLDPERVGFFGHSHGGLSGTLAMAVDDHISVGVISGMAGLIIETILRRKDPADLSALASGLLGISSNLFDEFHPALSLIQTLVDATDPINYTRFWLDPMPGRTAKHVFVTEGTLDAASPSVGTDAAAAAGRIPQVYPIAKESEGHRLRGLVPEALPLAGNVEVPGGGTRTAGLRQWQGGDHWVGLNAADAIALWRHFFWTAFYGDGPELGTGDAVLARPTPVSGADACGDARAIPTDAGFPIEVRGNNGLADATMHAGGCPGSEGEPGAAGRDLVWRFTPPVAGTYRFRIALPPAIDRDTPRFGPDLVTVAAACGAGAQPECLGSRADGALDLTLAADEAVYVTVDGSTVTDVGPFTLVIEQRCAVLDCGARECGSWGCGDCGACDDDAVCIDGTCEARRAGDTCESAVEASAVPFMWTGQGREYKDETSYEVGCESFPFIFGRASNDAVVRFTAPAAATYLFTLEGDYDVNLYVGGDCADPNASCLGAQRTGGRTARAPVALGAGEVAYTFVDGAGNSGNSAGRFALGIDVCEPSCEGRACGDDGCGGSCGACPDDGSCIVEPGKCQIPYGCPTTARCQAVPGDTCEQAFEVGNLPYSDSRNTNKFYPQYGFSYGWCPGVNQPFGFGASDVVYRFVAPATGLYRFLLDTGEWPNIFDASLYLVSGCADIAESCLGADERDRNERVWKQMTQGEEAFVIVDGWSNFSQQTGAYEIDVRQCVPSCANRVCGGDGCNGSCGGCGGGEACFQGQCIPSWGRSCDYPRGFGELPWREDLSTAGYDAARDNPCSGGASGDASKDVAYIFEAPGAGEYTFRVSGGFPVQLYVTRGCGDEAECVASGSSVDVTLNDKELVYVIVDGVDGDAAVEGSYRLEAQRTCHPQCDGKGCGPDGCGGTCGTCVVPVDVCDASQNCADPAARAGNTCALPFEVGALPFEGAGDTRESWNEYLVDELMCPSAAAGDGAAAPGFVAKGVGSNDQVWRFTAPAAGTYDVAVAPEGWDAIVYALGDCADPAGTCAAASDGQVIERMSLALGSGETVFIVVDGAENIKNDAGAYRLEVRARPGGE
ncbi:MAG: hypothetical protein IT385_03415 [Deltaproteobacteria bacterium]|nr:hypothetical protein [Deltaproteobacteria bacterium]